MNKDEIIHIISILEKEIRADYEKYTLPPPEIYEMIIDLFKNTEKLKTIPYQKKISVVIGRALNKAFLDPVTLKVIFEEVNLATDFDIEEKDYDWVAETFKGKVWDAVIIENIKQIIAVNVSGVNNDSRSGAAPVADIHLRCRMSVSNNKVTFKELVELIFRIKGSKYDNWYELYGGIKTHIDNNGTLFIAARFDHGS